MENVVINCKEISQKIKDEAKVQVSEIVKATDTRPHLVVVQVGEVQASNVYVRNKRNACEEVGIKSSAIKFTESVTQEELEDTIIKLNNNPNVHGVLVQLPLPKHLDEERVAQLIDWKKDVDGFHPYIQGKLARGEELDKLPLPCTVTGVVEIINGLGVDLEGTNVTVVGRSSIVGMPLSILLTHLNATVTTCHSKTQYLSSQTRKAHIVVVATGRAKMFDQQYFTSGQLVIDVGINRDENGKLCGDCNTQNILDYKSGMYITPVPNGVGTLTVACLMKNVVKCYELQKSY